MQYFVMVDGQRYGPADVATLNAWAREGRLSPTTEVEDSTTGARLSAASIPGISFPTSAPPPGPGPTMSAPQEPGFSAPGVQPPGNWSQAPMQPGQWQAPGPMQSGGQTEFTLSIIFSIIGFLCCPIVFGTAGIILGVLAKQKGHPNGQIAWILGVVSLVGGIVLGVILQASLTNFMRF